MNEETTTTQARTRRAGAMHKPKRKQFLLPGGTIVNETTIQAWELTSQLRAQLRRLEELPRLHAHLVKARRERRRETLRVKRLARKHGPTARDLAREATGEEARADDDRSPVDERGDDDDPTTDDDAGALCAGDDDDGRARLHARGRSDDAPDRGVRSPATASASPNVRSVRAGVLRGNAELPSVR